MKKKLVSSVIVALVVALVISVAMFAVEGIFAHTKGYMPILQYSQVSGHNL